MKSLVIVLDASESPRLEAAHVDHFVLVGTPRARDAYVRAGEVRLERIIMTNSMGSDAKFAYALSMMNVGESATIIAAGFELTVTKERET